MDPLESEELYQRLLLATLGSVLTVNILSIDVDLEFLLLFVALLAARVWVWIGEWRVEWLSQQKSLRIRTYACVFTGLSLALAFEMFMFGYILSASKENNSAKLVTMFGFEHALLSASVMSTWLSFFVSVKDACMRFNAKFTRRAQVAVAGEVIPTINADTSTVIRDGPLDIAAEGGRCKREREGFCHMVLGILPTSGFK